MFLDRIKKYFKKDIVEYEGHDIFKEGKVGDEVIVFYNFKLLWGDNVRTGFRDFCESTIKSIEDGKLCLVDREGELHFYMDNVSTIEYHILRLYERDKKLMESMFYSRLNGSYIHLLRDLGYKGTLRDTSYVISKYHYDNNSSLGILSSIENSFGHRIHFEYIEDPNDLDERLNPRLKIKQISIPNGIIFQYEYDFHNNQVLVIISQNNVIERKILYTYQRDLENSKIRYISETKIEVKKGYIVKGNNTVPIPENSPQHLRSLHF